MINLKLVQVRGNLFGQAIAANYKSKPHDVLDMIKEQFRDNPHAVVETLGLENAKKLGLLNPLAKFVDYFPSTVRGVHDNYLIYEYSEIRSLVNSLRRARAIISDLGLPLKAQGYHHKESFKLYIYK